VQRVDLLGVLAVNAVPPFHRQDAKSAKNFAKQNSFQMSVFSHPPRDKPVRCPR